MAQKTITELQLADEASDGLSIPADDGIQSYRVTVAQIKEFFFPDEVITRNLLLETERTPVGVVFPYAGTTVPSGWLHSDDSQITRTTYEDLFTAIGTAHGTGNGTTTFHIPDYRGRFLRGFADSQTTDPDRATRTAMNAGGATGDNVGSIQGHAFQTHTHTQPAHTHTQPAHTHTQPSHNHTQDAHGHAWETGSGSSTSGYTGGITTNNVTTKTAPANTGAHSDADSDQIAGATATNNPATATNSPTTATNSPTTATNADAAASGTHSQTSTSESRPVNATVKFIIKY